MTCCSDSVGDMLESDLSIKIKTCMLEPKCMRHKTSSCLVDLSEGENESINTGEWGSTHSQADNCYFVLRHPILHKMC